MQKIDNRPLWVAKVGIAVLTGFFVLNGVVRQDWPGVAMFAVAGVATYMIALKIIQPAKTEQKGPEANLQEHLNQKPVEPNKPVKEESHAV